MYLHCSCLSLTTWWDFVCLQKHWPLKIVKILFSLEECYFVNFSVCYTFFQNSQLWLRWSSKFCLVVHCISVSHKQIRNKQLQWLLPALLLFGYLWFWTMNKWSLSLNTHYYYQVKHDFPLWHDNVINLLVFSLSLSLSRPFAKHSRSMIVFRI